jgi:hypothetical protein
MAKTGQNITFYKRNRVVIRLTIVDEDQVGEPALDLTSYLLKYAICKVGANGPLVATPVIDVSSAGGQVVKTDAVNGEVEITLDETDTDLLKAGTAYYHELEVFDALGNPVVSMTGDVTVLPNIVNA